MRQELAEMGSALAGLLDYREITMGLDTASKKDISWERDKRVAKDGPGDIFGQGRKNMTGFTGIDSAVD